MSHCIIWPIPLVEMTIDKSMMTYRLNFGEPFTQIVYIWYIEGPKEKILVDGGVSADYFVKKRGMPARDIQTLKEGLEKFGLKKTDIDMVILTQLHHDHVAQAKEFTNAKFLIQKTELEFGLNPHPTVLIISHDMNIVGEADHIYILNEGRIVSSGNFMTLFSQKDEVRRNASR